MRRKNLALRLLSGLVAMNVLLQPVVAAVSGLTSAKQLQEGLVKSGVFSNANAPEAESLAAVWGDYLAVFSARAESLSARLAYEKQLTGALQDQLAGWERLRAVLRPEGEAVKLAESVEKLDRLLRTSLERKLGTISELQGHVESIAAAAQQQQTADAKVFVAAYEFDMTARLLDSESDLTDRVWNTLVLGQAELLGAVDATETQCTAGVTLSADLEKLRESEPNILESWNATCSALAAACTPHQKTDWAREAGLIEASRRLANRASESLLGKSDANSKAHAAMVQRFASIVDHRMEQLAALATEPVAGVRESSFLQVADAATLKSGWAEHARQHEAIGRRLVGGLADADVIFKENYQVAERTLNEARQLIGTIARAEAPGQEEAFATVKESLVAADPGLDRYEKALLQLDGLRRSLLDQVTTGGKRPFVQADLRNRDEAFVYGKLGQVYELAHALLLEMRLEIGGVQTLVAAAQELGVDTQSTGLHASTDAFDSFLSRWGSQTEAQQEGLEQLRKLSFQVAGDYTRDLAAFASSLKVGTESHKGAYGKVLESMQAWTQRVADTVAGLTTPMFDAVGGDAPQLTAPVLSWTGTATLQGVLKRTIERGHYFQTTGATDLATLNNSTASEGTAGFASSLALVDLAIALDYPTRTFVAPDGMVIVVGTDGAGAIIRGIGNPEQYRLDPSAQQASIIPDFSVQGILVGWNLWGDFQNFANDAGQAVDAQVAAIGSAANQAVQGVQKFGAQVVDAVGPVVDATTKFAVEVGACLWDSAVTMGEDIWKDPFKLAEYGIYGAALVGAGALTVATGGAAAPLLIVTAKYVGTQVVLDYGKAVAKTLVKRGHIDETTGALITLGIDLVNIVSSVKNLAKVPKVISGVPKLLRGVTPLWTAGLLKPLRDLAQASKISWELARYLQYAKTAKDAYKAVKKIWSVGNDVIALVDALERSVSLQLSPIGMYSLKAQKPLKINPLVSPPPLKNTPLKW